MCIFKLKPAHALTSHARARSIKTTVSASGLASRQSGELSKLLAKRVAAQIERSLEFGIVQLEDLPLDFCQTLPDELGEGLAQVRLDRGHGRAGDADFDRVVDGPHLRLHIPDERGPLLVGLGWVLVDLPYHWLSARNTEP